MSDTKNTQGATPPVPPVNGQQNQTAQGAAPLAAPAGPAPEPKKTTPDEGKTFDTDMVFECVRDCYQNRVRYRPGDVRTGRTCPPHFRVKGKSPIRQDGGAEKK